MLNTRKVLYVSPGGLSSKWKVHCQGSLMVTFFDNKDKAIYHAKLLVGRYPKGYCSQIKVKKLDGTFQTEWTYGKDPFPPIG